MKRGLVMLLALSSVLAHAAPPAAAVPAAKPAAPNVPPEVAAPSPPTGNASPADPLDALISDSPFGAPAGGARAAAATGPLELRSVVFVDGAFQFSIFDQGTGKANWVRIGERDQPYVVRSFNREQDSLTVEHQGRTMVLALQPAKMASVAPANAPQGAPPLPGPNDGRRPNNVPPNMAPNANGPGNPNASPAPAGPNANTNAAEAQRLQNLADEIRRRRGAGPQLVLPRRN